MRVIWTTLQVGRSGSSGACSMCFAYCILSMFLWSKRFRNTGSCRKQSVNAVNTNIFDVDRLKDLKSPLVLWGYITNPPGFFGGHSLYRLQAPDSGLFRSGPRRCWTVLRCSFAAAWCCCFDIEHPHLETVTTWNCVFETVKIKLIVNYGGNRHRSINDHMCFSS